MILTHLLPPRRRRRGIDVWGSDRLDHHHRCTRPFLSPLGPPIPTPCNPLIHSRTVRLPPVRWWAQRENAEWRPRTTPGCRRRPRRSLIHGWVLGYRCICYSLFYSAEGEKGWDLSPFLFLISICLVKITAMSTSKEIFLLYYSSCPSLPFNWHFVLSCIDSFKALVYFFRAFDTINCSESILLLARHVDSLC